MIHVLLKPALRLGVATTLCAAVAAPAAAQQPFGIVDAVRTAMTEHADVRLVEQQLESSRSGVLIAGSPFETRYQLNLDRQRTVTPLVAGGEALTNLTSWQAGFARQLRNGLIIAPSISLERQDLSLDPFVPNRASASLVVTQPLMRGRGEAAVTAAERAARFGVSASQLDLQHTVEAAAFRTVAGYWNYVAASRNLAIVQETEERARLLVQQVQALINADNRPAAEIKQVQANLANRVAFRLSAEHGVLNARHALGLAMGIPLDAIGTLPLPADDFPAVPDVVPALTNQVLAERAFLERADLDALQQRTEQAQSLMTAAVDALKPQFDLQLGLGYSGLDQGRGFGSLFTPFERRASGPNVTLGFTYDWSLSRDAARGTLGQQESLYRQTQIQAAELRRTIASAVAVARDDLTRSIARVRATREAAAIYRSAVDDEREKLQLGLGTIIDLVLTEDRLTQSRLDQVIAELDYAQAVARLRFESGTLLPADAAPAAVTREQLTTVPAIQ